MENGHGWPQIHARLGQFLACLPQFCCFCHRKTDTGYDLCRYCRIHLPAIVDKTGQKSASSVCLRCGFILPDSTYRQHCANCVNYQTRIEQVVCPFRYDFPIDGLIGRLKYRAHLATGRLLGNLLAEEIIGTLDSHDFPDCLVPVPLNNSRYRARGFNHAAEMAYWCGKAIGVESKPDSVGRRLDTGSLVGLTRAERGMRIRGAFWAHERLIGRRVAIVDDVLTTGATAGELATELIDQGVSSVQLWVIARTPMVGKLGSS